MALPVLHARQFLLGPEPRQVAPDWVVVRLGDRLWLSHSPALPVTGSGGRWLLGTAVSTDETDRIEAWTGRWVLIDQGRLRLDAFGTLGVFHLTDGSGVWASSSPALMASLFDRPAVGRLRKHSKEMPWFPPPASGVEGVRRLLPSQVLDLSDGSLAPRRLLEPVPPTPYEVLLERIGRRLVTALSRLGTDGAWLPLSGGRDSRLLLAAAIAAGVPLQTWTVHRPVTPAWDLELPPRLARAVGVPHRMVPVKRVDRSRIATYDAHTAGHCVDGPRAQVLGGGLDFVPADALVLGGGVFGVAREYYIDRVPVTVDGPEQAAAAVLARWHSDTPEGVRAWARWAADAPEPIDWRDRLYLEQRMAGWLSSNSQAVDIANIRVAHLANCSALISEVLALPLDRRADGMHQVELIARLAPPLADFPVQLGHHGRGG